MIYNPKSVNDPMIGKIQASSEDIRSGISSSSSSSPPVPEGFKLGRDPNAPAYMDPTARVSNPA